jgi:hypothetical protein
MCSAENLERLPYEAPVRRETAHMLGLSHWSACGGASCELEVLRGIEADRSQRAGATPYAAAGRMALHLGLLQLRNAASTLLELP